jgi:hypothetical protein
VVVPTLILVGALIYQAVSAAQQQRMVANARQAGLAAFERGELDEALRNFGVFFQFEKDDLDIDQKFAEARARRPLPNSKHVREAIDLYANHCLKLLEAQPRTAERDARRIDIMHRLLDLYGQFGMHLELISVADKLLTIAPEDKDGLSAKAETLLITRRFDEGLPLSQRLIELEPDDLGWRRLHLELLSGQGASNDQLVDQCRQWAQNSTQDAAAPTHVDCRFHLLTAAMLDQLNRSDDAAAELRFRDALRADSALAGRYVALKEALALVQNLAADTPLAWAGLRIEVLDDGEDAADKAW